MSNAGSTIGGRNLITSIPVITGTIIDNVNIGAMGVSLVARAIGTGATMLTHKLRRLPNGFLVYNNSSGGVVYATTGDVAAWTTTTVTLRATVAGTFSMILI